MPQFGDFPLVVAAERKQRLQGGESAAAERALESVELGEGSAYLDGVDLGIAGRFFYQCLFGLGDEPGLKFPVPADSLGGFGIQPARKRGDLLT